MSERDSDLMQAALGYAADGLAVFPLAAEGKEPVTRRGYYDATTDAQQIMKWWRAHPDARIGLPCRPNGLIAIDIDPRNGGSATFKALEAEHGALPRDAVQRTHGGGWHVVMLDPAPGADGWTRVHGAGGSCKGKLGPGVDVKNNGYIVVDPSPGYEWIASGQFPAVPPAWQRLLRKAEKERVAAPSSAGDWSKPITMSDADDLGALRVALDGLPDQGEGKGATYAAFKLVFHDWGLSVDEGWPLICEWNTRHDEGELERQLERVAERVAEKIETGEITKPRGAEHPSSNALPFDPGRRREGARSGSAAPQERETVNGAVDIEASKAPAPSKGALRLSDVARAPRPPVRAHETPWPELNRLIGGGVLTRKLLAVCAPPAMGKSGWAVQLAMQLHTEIPILHVSTELESDELLARFASPLIDLPWRDIERGQMPWPAPKLPDVVAEHRVFVLGSEKMPLDGEKALRLIYTEAKKLKDEHGAAPGIVVDYLQDLARSQSKEVRQVVGGLATQFRAMAQDLDSPVVVVSSVSRSFYGKGKSQTQRDVDDPTSWLDAAKESGDVDYSASTVLFLDVDKTVKDAEGRASARFIVAKARQGESGFVGAKFAGATGTWIESKEALEEMTPEARAVRQASAKESKVDQAILEWFEKNADPNVGATYRRVREALHVGSYTDRKAALERLVDEKKLEQIGKTFRLPRKKGE